MSDKEKDRVLILTWVITVLFIIAAIIISKPDSIGLDGVQNFNNGWIVSTDEENQKVMFSRNISKTMLGKSLTFYTQDSFVDVKINGISIYSYGHKSVLTSTPGSYRHLVNIPMDSYNKKLNVCIKTEFKSKYKEEYNFDLGDSGSIIFKYISKEIPDIITTVILLVASLMLIGVYALQYVYKFDNKSNLYLGLVTICIALWSNCGLFINQMMLPYGILQYYVYYATIMFLPAMIMLYLESLCDDLSLNNILGVHFVLSSFLSVFQVTKMYEYTESLNIFFIYASAEIIISIILFIVNKTKHITIDMTVTAVIFILSIAVNYILYELGDKEIIYLVIVKLGYLLFLYTAIKGSIVGLFKDLVQLRNTKLLQKLAYTDNLTQLGNRHAFIENIIQEDLSSLSLVSIDVNNLKYYNDTYGHEIGDELIKQAAEVLDSVYDNVYRTGGDEFVALCKDINKDKLHELKTKVNYLCKLNSNFVLEIAVGYSSYVDGDASYEAILKRADKYMYRHKKKLKKNSEIKSIR